MRLMPAAMRPTCCSAARGGVRGADRTTEVRRLKGTLAEHSLVDETCPFSVYSTLWYE